MAQLSVGTQTGQQTLQKTTFTQQLARNISLLSHTVTQLRHDVLEAVTENPALEIKEEPDHESLEAIQYQKYSGADANNRFEFIESLLVSPQTLHEYLTRQLHLAVDTPPERAVGERIIDNLDEHGFYTESPETLCADIPDTDAALIQSVTKTIQAFDPVGCATANALDSLHVQIAQLDISSDIKEQLIECVFLMAVPESGGDKKVNNDTDAHNIAARAVAEYCEQHDIARYLHDITPYPGLAYNPNITAAREEYIIPDAEIVMENGELRVRVNNDIVPIVDISEDMAKAARGSDKQSAAFAARYVQSAQAFITGLQYRNTALEKIVLFIAGAQADFFSGAHEYPEPLTRKDIASALELNESTVSRIVAQKYLQTPRGMFEIKHFLSHSVGATDASVSKVEQAIQTIISAAHDGKKPSDEAITRELAAQGISIARRTVAKYRKKLKAHE